jgi:GrpB-like predicted nucleotidyltransferase (UPF0157 family)
MEKREPRKIEWVHHSFKKYNPDFPKWFSHERNELKRVLKKEKIEHIGSTSVPGLGGKGIVDIAVFSPQKLIEHAKKKISSLGYEEWPVPKKMKFFSFKKYYGTEVYPDKVFHIHITSDKKVFEKMTMFGDYLREHPTTTEEYAKIKKKASKTCKGNFLVYRKAKNPFIKSVLKKAEKEK